MASAPQAGSLQRASPAPGQASPAACAPPRRPPNPRKPGYVTGSLAATPSREELLDTIENFSRRSLGPPVWNLQNPTESHR
jgi:hypothetical protein